MLASDSTSVVQRITPGGLMPDNTWLRRATVGFRKSQSLSKDGNGRPIDMMRLSVDAIGTRAKPVSTDVRPHTAITAKRNSSATMAEVIGARPITAKVGTNKSVEHYVHPVIKPAIDNFEPSYPNFVKTDKLVLRFYGYFLEDRVWDQRAPLGNSTIEGKICRNLTIYYYIVDNTVEMIEPKVSNSGIKGGVFSRRDTLVGEDGHSVQATDFEVGGTVRALSREIYIVDADSFTREYFSREFGITLTDAQKRPQQLREDLGAQFATGLVATLPTDKLSYGIRSTDYVDNKRNVMRAKQFLNFDGRALRFLALETISLDREPNDDGYPKLAKGQQKKYILTYYLTDNTIETRLMRSTKTNVDDGTVVMKRCELPKNWRSVHEKFVEPEYYQPQDMVCGNVIDCFGRYFLLVNCDASSLKVSRDIGLDQREVVIAKADPDVIRHAVPKLGDLFLPIGAEEDTLRTVHHAQKPKKDLMKAINYKDKYIRARVAMLSTDSVQTTREFLLTYFLEDDTLQVFEQAKYNSGIEAGRFLRRGKYVNNLPPDSSTPRHFVPTDIFLGNVIETSGAKFQILEIDALSMRICEDRPQEFPLFDAFRIASVCLPRVLNLPEDLRATLTSRVDRSGTGWLSKQNLLAALEQLRITQTLNDQEVSTLLHRVVDKDDERYYYHELCDLWSHLARSRRSNNRLQRPSSTALLGALGDSQKSAMMDSLRCRKVQWRRTIRKDPRSRDGRVTLFTLVAVFRRQGVRLSQANIDLIRENYRCRDIDEVQTSMNLEEPILFEKAASTRSIDMDQLAKTMERPDIRSSSRLNRTNMVGVSISPWMGARPTADYQVVLSPKKDSKKDIQSRRQEMMRSVLRSGLNTAEFDLGDLVPETDQNGSLMEVENVDDKFVVIDYDSLCNDIYGEIAK